jgi:hypothetical protein
MYVGTALQSKAGFVHLNCNAIRVNESFAFSTLTVNNYDCDLIGVFLLFCSRICHSRRRRAKNLPWGNDTNFVIILVSTYYILLF